MSSRTTCVRTLSSRGSTVEHLEPRRLMADGTGASAVISESTVTAAATAAPTSAASNAISAQFNAQGLSRLTYRGHVLYDITRDTNAGFRVADFNILQNGVTTHYWPHQTTFTTSWNPTTQANYVNYSWGYVEGRWFIGADRIDLSITVKNKTTDQTIAGINVHPLGVRLPNIPSNLVYGRVSDGTGLPVVVADFGGSAGQMSMVKEKLDQQLYFGFDAAGAKTTETNYFDVRVGTAKFPGKERSLTNFVVNVPPGTTHTYRVSMRFDDAGTAPAAVAPDINQAYQMAQPMTLVWNDRRPIYMTMAAGGSEDHRSALNPNGWLDLLSLDVSTPAGRATLKTEMIKWATRQAQIVGEIGGQGLIWWDMEGMANNTINYVGDPRLATTLAPEMNDIYKAVFDVFKAAGINYGVTIRPTEITYDSTGTPWQTPVANPGALLAEKIAYAKTNWGCNLFYIDSNKAYDPDAIRIAHEAHPDVLLIPEHQSSVFYSFSAPYQNYPRDAVTSSATRDVWSQAFTVVRPPLSLTAAQRNELVTAVRRGDILLADAGQRGTVSSLQAEATQLGSLRPPPTGVSGANSPLKENVDPYAPSQPPDLSVPVGPSMPSGWTPSTRPTPTPTTAPIGRLFSNQPIIHPTAVTASTDMSRFVFNRETPLSSSLPDDSGDESLLADLLAN